MSDGIPSFIEKKKFLMDLLMMGVIEDEFDIIGNKVKFRSLNSDENLESMKEATGYDGATKVFMLQMSLMSKALVSINGDFIPTVEEARTLFGKLPPVVVEEFWRRYDELRARRDLLVERGIIDLKKSLRNPSPDNSGDTVKSASPSGSAPSIL